jgi:hypothetical protein
MLMMTGSDEFSRRQELRALHGTRTAIRWCRNFGGNTLIAIANGYATLLWDEMGMRLAR